jgi:hypothetical protein
MPFYRTNLGIFYDLTYVNNPPVLTFVKEKIKYEDVNAWEILHEEIDENGVKLGIYASHDPYGDFYIIKNSNEIVEFFGESAESEIEQYLKNNNIEYRLNDKVSIGSSSFFKENK